MKRDLAHQFLSTLHLPPAVVDSALADLEVMAQYKYDHYEMFAPGTRFLEHLFSWLKQFDVADREAAIEFVRRRLVFISQREMQDLARFLYFDRIVPSILEYIIKQEHLAPYAYADAFGFYFRKYLRRCLFVGLSDGAKIDFFRRHHIQLSQEQVLPYYRTVDAEYRERLKEDLDDPQAEFWALFLIDDFTGSGYTLIREDTPGTMDGALHRVSEYHPELFERAERIYVCHYVATERARDHVRASMLRHPAYGTKGDVLTALVLPDSLAINPSAAHDELGQAVVRMCEKYHRDAFENAHTKRGGGIKFGFGNQGLPLVLYSNAPNNSIYLLWLDRRDGAPVDRFAALFRRIERHRLEWS